MIKQLEDLPLDDNTENTSILMITCNRYRSAWGPFITLFNRYWKDCPYEFYVGTDVGEIDDVNVISPGKDLGWPQNCLYAVERIKSDKIILFQEDFLLTDPVDSSAVSKFVRYSHDHDIGCIRLCPCPGPKDPWPQAPEVFGEIHPTDLYSFSLQLAIWDRKVLIDRLSESNVIHDFEHSSLNRKVPVLQKPFLGVWRESYHVAGGPIRYYITGVVQSKWHKGAIDLLKKENIPADHLDHNKRL